MKSALKRILNVDMKRIQSSNLNENGIYIEFDEKYSHEIDTKLDFKILEALAKNESN